jgi:hypothetical protein
MFSVASGTAGENVGLHGGAERDDFIGIQDQCAACAGRVPLPSADFGNARRSADQDDFVDLLGQ